MAFDQGLSYQGLSYQGLSVMSILFLPAGLVEDVSEVASAAILTVKVSGHEDAGAAVFVGTLTTKTGDLAVLVNLTQ